MATRLRPSPSTRRRVTLGTMFLCGLAAFALASEPVWADPPPWAPAHGYRAKKKAKGKYKHKYKRGYYQQQAYVLPPGLRGGRCQPNLFDSATIGTLIGAATGGFTGSQIGQGRGKLAATAIGTLLGAVIGHEVGNQIARSEDVCFSQTFEHVPDRETITWTDAQQGANYQVTPMKTARTSSGEYCREYIAKATVGSKVVDTYGTACRQPDGSWKLVN